MEKQIEDKNIDIKVFNALNLINPALGEAYENNNFNPFETDFELKDEFVTKVLQNSRITKDVPSPEFLEFGSKTVKQHFIISLENNKNVLAGVENVSTLNDSRDFSDIKLFLKNRILLLEHAIKSLSNANANSLQLYEEIYRLNYTYSEVMEGSYFEGFDVQGAINTFVRLAPPIRSNASKKEVIATKTATQSKTTSINKAIPTPPKRPVQTKNTEREM